MMRGAGTCAPRRLGAATGPGAPPTQSLSSRPTAVPADAAGAPPPTDELTSKGRGPAPGTVTGFSRGREREASTFSDPSFVPRRTGTDRRPRERRCLAFRSDAGQPPTVDESEAPRILVPVGRLGRHDAAHQYTRKHVTVTCGGSTLQVWLNVTPDAVEGPQPMLRQDEEGEWHVDENVPGHQGGRDYEDFCAAANSTKVSPQVVRIVRRWPRTRARPRQRPRRTASALETGHGKARRGRETARGLMSDAREATINYYDVLAPTDEEPGVVAAPPHVLESCGTDAGRDSGDGARGDGGSNGGLDATASPFVPAAARTHEGGGDPPAQEDAAAAQEGAAERAVENRSGVSAPADQGSGAGGSSQDPPLSSTAPPKTSECGPEGGNCCPNFNSAWSGGNGITAAPIVEQEPQQHEPPQRRPQQ